MSVASRPRLEVERRERDRSPRPVAEAFFSFLSPGGGVCFRPTARKEPVRDR